MIRPMGWFGEDEGKEVQDITRSVPTNGIIIEIGTWRGLSTSYIAEALTNEQTLITIDSYSDGSEAFEVTNIRPHDARKMFFEFFFNERLFKKKVIPILGSSAEIAELFKTSSMNIDFLFIDGDHKYGSVKIDYYMWSIFNPTYVVFHDYTNSPYVLRFVNEIKEDYKYFKLVGSMAVLKERKKIILKSF
jgi:predicted O-methyltransferase YrrM